MRKFIIVAEMRDLEKQLGREEISYSRMCEMLKEKVNLLCEEVKTKKFKRRK